MKKNIKQFEQLLEKYQAGLLKGEQQELMDHWFDSFDEEESENWPNTNRTELKAKILKQINTHSTKPNFTIQRNPKRHWFKVAAAILALAISSLVVWEYASELKTPGVEIVEKFSSSNIEKIMLSDGSIIWLKEFSKLTYPSQFDGSTRNVTLEGEALFEVAKDPSHPFIIKCGELETTVLGTSFNIRAQQDNIEVTVLTGKVSLATSQSDQKLVLTPNETGIFRKSQKLITKVDTRPEENQIAMAGTEYFMLFEDSDMASIIQRIENKFNVSVKIADPTLANCRITADFTDQSLDRTMSMISRVLGVNYKINNKQVTISGLGCK